MNEFTKEELNKLLRIVDHYRGMTDDISQVYLSLQKRIQSMIENYCEHDPHGDFHVCVDKCRKCGVICK